jgi:geranylgeranyl pyrophosphate synthase
LTREFHTLGAALEGIRIQVDRRLEEILPPGDGRNGRLLQAMRHTLFASGKRFRPALVLLGTEAVGGERADALDCACAAELLHTYSLIHDDLPSMDDAELRRGIPSSHRAFDEGTAVLAGDALLTLSFELLAASYPEKGAALVLELARGAGYRGMIAGQVQDLASSGTTPDEETLRFIHENKTGALIVACLRMGGILGQGPGNLLDALTRFGRAVGLAFQIVDDILDETAEESQSGKTAGADRNAGKVTFPALYGLPKSSRFAQDLTEQAVRDAASLPYPDLLVDLARYIVQRTA